MQSTHSAQHTVTVFRRQTRHPHFAQRRHTIAGEARAVTGSGERDFRAQLADAFLKLGTGADAQAAQSQAMAFYRSSRQDWARALEGTGDRDFRSEIAAAFRTLGTGVDQATAHDRMRAFYRSSGQAWAHNLA